MKKIFSKFLIASIFTVGMLSLSTEIAEANVLDTILDNAGQVATDTAVRTADGFVNGIFNPAGLPSGTFALPSASEFGTEIGTNRSARTYAIKVVNFFLSFLGLIAVIFVIFAGFTYVTAGGDDGQHDKAKKIILYAVVGILVILVSFALVNTVIEGGTEGDDRDISYNIDTSPGSSGSSSLALSTNTEEALNGLFSNLTTNIFNEGVFTRSQSLSLINVKAEGAIETDKAWYVSLEEARNGIEFSFQSQSEVGWVMGDGTEFITAPGATFKHVYGQANTYVVQAVSIDTLGQPVLQTRSIVVGESLAAFYPSTETPVSKEAVLLDATITDLSAIGGTIVEYNWTCEGGAGCFPKAEGALISVQFDSPGQYAVTLEIKTSEGIVDSITKAFPVTGDKPYSFFTANPVTDVTKKGVYILDGSYSRSQLGDTKNLSYIWTIDGEELVTTDPVLEYKFADKKSYIVELIVKEQTFGQSFVSDVFNKSIVVEDVLSVNFDYSPQEVFVGESVSFTSEVDGFVRYLWDFGEGITSRDENPVMKFNTTGERVVTLKVQSGEEETVIEKSFFVRNSKKPTALLEFFVNQKKQAVGDVLVIHKNDILEINSLSVDRFGKSKDFFETWFVDGQRVGKKEVESLVKGFGEHEVRLVIVHPEFPDQRDEITQKIIIENKSPIIKSFNVVSRDDLPAGSVFLKADVSDYENQTLTYAFSAFNGSQREVSESTKNSESILTLKNGSYTFEVTVTDTEGARVKQKSTGIIEISGVKNDSPTGDFVVDPPIFHYTTTDFVFTAQVQDKDKDILHYKWFVDEKLVEKNTTGILRSINFPKPGTYFVKMQVDDLRGGMIERETKIDVAWDPNIRTAESNTKPTVKICTQKGTTVHRGTSLQFWGQGEDLDGDVLTYYWSVDGNDTYSSLQHISHKFSELGEYTVALSVRDDFHSAVDAKVFTVVEQNTLLPLPENVTCGGKKDIWIEDTKQNVRRILRIVPTKNVDNFFDIIGWSKPLTVEENQKQSNDIQQLSELGVLGLQNAFDISLLLEERENTLTQLVENNTNPVVQKKLAYELDLLKTDPISSLEKHLRSIRVDDAKIVPTLKIAPQSKVTLRANVPSEFKLPLLFEWKMGDGEVLYGQNIQYSYEKPGYYLATVFIDDGLTQIRDSIIILVENRR